MNGQQWKPLQPTMEGNGFGGNGGGGSGFPQQRQPRQITKTSSGGTPSMFQNFPNGFSSNGSGGSFGNNGSRGGNMPTTVSPPNTFRSSGNSGMSPNNGFHHGGGGGGSHDSFVRHSGGGGGQLSPHTGGFNGSFNGGNSTASNMFGGGAPRSPNGGGFGGNDSFGGSGGGRGHNGFSSYENNSMSNGYGGDHHGSSRHGGMINNGFNSTNNDHRNNSFDRSMSTSSFENNGFGHNNRTSNGVGGGGMPNGYDRQMSAPNLRDQHQMNGGYGSRGGHGNPNHSRGGGNDYSRGGMYGGGGRPSSPPNDIFSGNGGGDSNFMKIGTWNDPSGGGSGGGSGSNNHHSGGHGNGGMMSGGGMNGDRFGNGGSSAANAPPAFEIGTFNLANPGASSGGHGHDFGGNSQSGNNIQGGPGIRETGIIEKLLHSYGFIQCCDRQARLFFHFSQFDGNIEHLKIGDPVEFEMTYDRRTGKPIASMVSKIAPEVVMSEERVIGAVTTETKIDSESGQETHGRISYENRGECFFLPFTQSDVEGHVVVAPGDKVSFQMATMARSGNLVARTIRLENPAAPVKYHGVINSIKENSGYIERADVVREIYFHFSEMKQEPCTPKLGDHVEFTIQTRNQKEVACEITVLPEGTVVFVDVGTTVIKGQVLKPLDKLAGKYDENEPLNGRVKYRGANHSEEEVQFGDKDQVGDFTLRHGDWVQFVIAVDRRDKLKRATKIELMSESFQVSDERREQGKIQHLKISDGFGFIRCAERDAKMYFNISEILDVKRTMAIGDEVEFTVSADSLANNTAKSQTAIRIKHLEPGTVKFDVILHKDVLGTVEDVPKAFPISGSESDIDPTVKKDNAGKIIYDLEGLGTGISISVHSLDIGALRLHKGDVVKFDINQCKATKETSARNIVIVESTRPIEEVVTTPKQASSSAVSGKASAEVVTQERALGYIAALKDGFGFLETLCHDKEIFFHFSNVEGKYSGKAEKLEVGMEVEYCVYNREKGGKLSAEGVKVLSKGAIPAWEGKDDLLVGKVIRPLRSVNPDQDDYCGLIQVARTEDDTTEVKYTFGIASLSNKKELLQVGDPVQFQPSAKEAGFAVNIKSTREKNRATVEAMKGQFGFLSFEVEEGKKLFFHTTEVEGGEVLQQGDEVDFVVATNKRTGKHSACCVRKISSCKRPDRLISKLKGLNLEGKKVIAIRAPKGPDGTNGFKVSRSPATNTFVSVSA